MPARAVCTSLIFKFLNDAKSPAKPTKLVDSIEAFSCESPIDVDISPNIADISKAVPISIPNPLPAILAKSFTDCEALPNATSTLFIDSL